VLERLLSFKSILFPFDLIASYIRKSISQIYKPTIGADFHSKKLEVEDEGETKLITLQIWDTAGQEKYQSLGIQYYRGAEACILVYDITDAKSFDNLSNWKTQFLTKSQPKNPDSFPFFIIGNKVDLEANRAVITQSDTLDFEWQGGGVAGSEWGSSIRGNFCQRKPKRGQHVQSNSADSPCQTQD